MKRITHDEAFAELDAVAFDLLDAADRDALLAHIEQCAECRAELDRRRALVADLAFAAPLSADTATGGRARIRERLMWRALAEAQVHSGPVMPASTAPSQRAPANTKRTSSPPILLPTPHQTVHFARGQTRFQKYSGLFALAAGILFVASLGLLGVTVRDRDYLKDALDAQKLASSSASRAADSLARLVALRDSLLAGLTGRDVTMMTLTSKAAKEPYARMFWDRARNRWTFLAHNMPALKAGRTYQLWLVTSKAKISAGTFEPRNGEAIVQATYALLDPLDAVAVTEEPAGGVPQPTGATVVAATTR